MKSINLIPVVLLLLFILMSCTTKPKPAYQLTATAEPAEAGMVTPGTAEVDAGDSIHITATPNENWVFNQWGGDHTGNTNPANVLMSSDKSVTALFIKNDSQLTDIDGNVYETVVIGDQEWMAENLRVTRFQDGSELSTGLDLDQWVQTNNGAYAVYPHTNEEVNNVQTVDEMVDTYGYLYNWYAIDSYREICPTGWKIPSDDDWKTLETFLGIPEHEVDEYWTNEDHVRRGLNENVGGKLKATGNTYWQLPNEGATNITGFSALPAGVLSVLPDDQGPSFLWYSGHGKFTYYWSSTKFNHENSPGGKVMWGRGLTFESGEIIRSNLIIYAGLSVRCIRY